MSAQAIPLQIVRACHLELTVTDPEVVSELELRSGADRHDFAVHALRIGTLALRQASGGLDVDAIRRSGAEVVAQVREAFLEHATYVKDGLGKVVAQYFDPASGSLPQRIEQLVKGDGDLERMLTKHIDGDRSTLHLTLENMVGAGSPLIKLLSPEQAGSVVASIRTSVDELLKKQRDEVLREFNLNQKDSALSRLLDEVTTANGKLRGELQQDVESVAREFSLDNEEGALSRLVGRVENAQKTIVEQLSLDHEGSALQRMSNLLDNTKKTIEDSLTLNVETSPLARLRRELVQISERIETSQAKFHADMHAVVATLQTRKQEAERSPRHGHNFEDAMEDYLSLEAAKAGDVYERVGTRPGSAGTKKGDHVVALGPESAAPGARIVVESKAQKNYTEAGALEEVEDARKNRDAQVGVFIFKLSRAPKSLDGFRRIGNDVLAVWDPEDTATDLYLRVAMSIARALVVREQAVDERSESSLREIERAVREIEKQVKAIEDIAKAARVVQSKGSSILEIADEMKRVLEAQLESLNENVDALREETSE